MGGAVTPIPQEVRDQVPPLHAQGLGRNEIAKRLGISMASVSNIAKAAGLRFDTARTAEGVAVRAADLRNRRQALELQLLIDAERLRAQMWVEAKYVDHGGKDFNRVDWTLDEPTPHDKLKLMQAVGIAAGRALDLAKVGTDDGSEGAASMLTGLFADVQGAWAAAQRERAAAETEPDSE